MRREEGRKEKEEVLYFNFKIEIFQKGIGRFELVSE